METPETTDLNAVFRRQRAIRGVCGKTQPDFSEQWIQRMSNSTEEKVRALQKTKSNSTGTNHSQKTSVSDWLDSPNTTAEAQLHRFDAEHPQTRNLPTKPKNSETSIHWKAASQSVALFDEN